MREITCPRAASNIQPGKRKRLKRIIQRAGEEDTVLEDVASEDPSGEDSDGDEQLLIIQVGCKCSCVPIDVLDRVTRRSQSLAGMKEPVMATNSVAVKLTKRSERQGSESRL